MALLFKKLIEVQVNLFQKHLFLHQLTLNLLSYFGLVDARISASEEDLPKYTVNFHANLSCHQLKK